MKLHGIRALRQWASRYIAILRRGGTVQVTDSGRPVALLLPISHGGVIERLGAQGRLTPEMGDLLDLGPPLDPKPGAALPSEVLTEMRADER